MPEEHFYKTGHVFKKLMSRKDELTGKDGFDLAAYFAENSEEVSTFKNYRYFILWAALLIKSGRDIKSELDKSLKELNKFKDSVYSKRKPIISIFEKITFFQQSIRNYENDVYDFINSFSATDINQKSSEISAISNVLEEINRTYDRVFNQAHQKLANISNARVSAASLLLSIIAVSVAIISIIISINFNKIDKAQKHKTRVVLSAISDSKFTFTHNAALHSNYWNVRNFHKMSTDLFGVSQLVSLIY